MRTAPIPKPAPQCPAAGRDRRGTGAPLCTGERRVMLDRGDARSPRRRLVGMPPPAGWIFARAHPPHRRPVEHGLDPPPQPARRLRLLRPDRLEHAKDEPRARAMRLKNLLEKWGMTSLKIKTPFFLEMDWQPHDQDRNAAWELYVELITRIATHRLDPDKGDEASGAGERGRAVPAHPRDDPAQRSGTASTSPGSPSSCSIRRSGRSPPSGTCWWPVERVSVATEEVVAAGSATGGHFAPDRRRSKK